MDVPAALSGTAGLALILSAGLKSAQSGAARAMLTRVFGGELTPVLFAAGLIAEALIGTLLVLSAEIGPPLAGAYLASATVVLALDFARHGVAGDCGCWGGSAPLDRTQWVYARDDEATSARESWRQMLRPLWTGTHNGVLLAMVLAPVLPTATHAVLTVLAGQVVVGSGVIAGTVWWRKQMQMVPHPYEAVIAPRLERLALDLEISDARWRIDDDGHRARRP